MTRPHILSLWLFFCAFMVVAMTAIGAITRLTESGLSITEWNVISGTLPPLNEAAWQEEFQKYQKSPEFISKHYWMTLSDFKGIFFWEWFHRLWGRLIGLAYAIPLVIFWKKNWIPREDRRKYLLLLALGASQGAMGWFMVKSGLVDRPSVSHFRLAAHLSLALTIFSALVWMGLYNLAYAWDLRRKPSRHIQIHAIASFVAIGITIIWGAFVAGLDAGMIYNTFPNMGVGLIPPELGRTDFLHDPASVQFTHRVLAIISGVITLSFGMRLFMLHRVLGGLIISGVLLQIGLGIATLLSNVFIPLAVAHQVNAALLLGTLIISIYTLRAANTPS